MKIYYARHTDADDDRRDSYGGISNDPLIDKGRDYARRVANAMVDKKIDLIFSSPYQRAYETATIINEEVKTQVIEIYNLRERNSYGVLSGIDKVTAKNLFPEIVQRISDMKNDGLKPSNSYETLPGAEIYLDLLIRAKDAFNTIFRESKFLKAENIMIVTHGGFSSAFFKNILKEDIELEKGEIIVLEGNNLEDLSINKEETILLKKSLS